MKKTVNEFVNNNKKIVVGILALVFLGGAIYGLTYEKAPQEENAEELSLRDADSEEVEVEIEVEVDKPQQEVVEEFTEVTTTEEIETGTSTSSNTTTANTTSNATSSSNSSSNTSSNTSTHSCTWVSSTVVVKESYNYTEDVTEWVNGSYFPATGKWFANSEGESVIGAYAKELALSGKSDQYVTQKKEIVTGTQTVTVPAETKTVYTCSGCGKTK